MTWFHWRTNRTREREHQQECERLRRYLERFISDLTYAIGVLRLSLQSIHRPEVRRPYEREILKDLRLLRQCRTALRWVNAGNVQAAYDVFGTIDNELESEFGS